MATNIALLNISVNYHTRILSDSSQEHFHLRQAGVLGLIQNHKGFAVKGFAAHKGQRCGHDTAVAQTVIGGTSAEALVQNIPKRSEEHTSELQSRGQLVCRLLLEK